MSRGWSCSATTLAETRRVCRFWALAGLAGALFASWGNFINPEVFSLPQAAVVVIWVLVGGRGTGVVTSAKNSGFSRCPAPLSNSASH